MPKAIKKKTGKKNVETEIHFQDKLKDIKGRLSEKKRTVLIYGIAALIAIVVLSAIGYYRYSENAKAAQFEYEAYKIYSNLYQKTPLPGQEQLQKALELFQNAYSREKSPKGLLYIADCYYALGKFDEAMKTLDDFLKRYSGKETLVPLAYQKIAAAQLKKGNSEEALKALDKISKSSVDILKDFALLESGSILELSGKKEEAKAKYKELTEKFPESPFVEEAKSRLGEKKAG